MNNKRKREKKVVISLKIDPWKVFL
jgi:hypothetical protein